MDPPLMFAQSGKYCEYGVAGVSVCGARSTTKRQRPSGTGTWDVCERHAATLDRVRESVRRHRPLLERLRD